jgi:hypothetical protein
METNMWFSLGQIVVGALLVGCGTALATYGWNRYSRAIQLDFESMRRKSYFQVFAGTVVVVLGSIGATWGWTQFAGYQRLNNMLVSVAREIELNERYRSRQSTIFDSTSDSAMFKEGLVPQLRDHALNALISSGLLTASDSTETELFRRLMDYEAEVDYLNRWLSINEWIRWESPSRAEALRKSYMTKNLAQLLSTERSLKQFLQEKFVRIDSLPMRKAVK